jgi:hypothetical protein
MYNTTIYLISCLKSDTCHLNSVGAPFESLPGYGLSYVFRGFPQLNQPNFVIIPLNRPQLILLLLMNSLFTYRPNILRDTESVVK